MLIDISDITGKKLSKKEINASFKGKNIIFEGEKIEFLEPINIIGSFNVIGDIVRFNGVIKTVLSLTCSRCLENFEYPLELEVNEKFSENSECIDEDIIIINNDKLDFWPIIEANIILSLPIKKLCSEKCKGLCEVCGTNLNYDTCNCKKEDVDPRLEKLKDFFNS